MAQSDQIYNKKWYNEGYEKGYLFARHEADYDELASVYRARGIPKNWDIYRAETLNKHLGNKDFDFQAYSVGFAQACIEFFEEI
ncbi:MAG: hypothetical protein U9R43_16180 [Thermodesulfobacteriota bacterium]|nr:hypothetical protein [Thermodesulfobacteriota bacterium]